MNFLKKKKPNNMKKVIGFDEKFDFYVKNWPSTVRLPRNDKLHCTAVRTVRGPNKQKKTH